MFDTMKVARKIREARNARNMTQMALADEMGVSYQAVSNWERGNSMPDISKLEQLCNVLHITVYELLGTDDAQSRTVSKILEKEELPELEEVSPDGGVAHLYRLPGGQGCVGLINPVNAHFCGECNRIRLTADGKLKPCLHAPDEYNLKGLDREGMLAVMRQAIWNKPVWHGELSAENRSQAGRNMNQIGG